MWVIEWWRNERWQPVLRDMAGTMEAFYTRADARTRLPYLKRDRVVLADAKLRVIKYQRA